MCKSSTQLAYNNEGELYADLHSTTQVVSRLNATVLGKNCVVVWICLKSVSILDGKIQTYMPSRSTFQKFSPAKDVKINLHIKLKHLKNADRFENNAKYLSITVV
jgi:hypothetical protein